MRQSNPFEKFKKKHRKGANSSIRQYEGPEASMLNEITLDAHTDTGGAKEDIPPPTVLIKAKVAKVSMIKTFKSKGKNRGALNK